MHISPAELLLRERRSITELFQQWAAAESRTQRAFPNALRAFSRDMNLVDSELVVDTGFARHAARFGSPDIAARLSSDERDAIERYTTGGSFALNSELRGRPELLTSPTQDRANLLASALDKLPEYHGVVLRSADLSDSELDTYRPGHIVNERAFSSFTAKSTTISRRVSMAAVSRTGKYISPFSGIPTEREVLFRNDSAFEVLTRWDEGNGRRTFLFLVDRSAG